MYPPYWFRLVKKVHIIPPEMSFFCYLSVIFHNLIQLIKKYVILTRNKSFRGGSIWEFEVLNIATDLKAINNKKKKD
jgi:hypothetical protein